MTPMRTAARTVAATAAALLLPSLLTGCVVDGGWLGGPAAPTTSTEAPATTATAASTPAPEPPATWPVNVPVQPGDCDPQAPDALLVTFVVTAQDPSAPIEISYPGFTPSVSGEPRTITTTGPVVTILGNDCGPGVATEPWTFTATGEVGYALSCAVFFNGFPLRADSDYVEGPARAASVDCTGRPGM
jgi:hypothetical protein